MNATVPIALFGIIPLAVLLAGCLRARPAILAGMFAGWLFLPEAKLAVVGIPDYDKLVATNLAVFLGCLLFHPKRLFSFRWAWYDLPIVMLCLSPAISSLTNDLGAYDAMSSGVRAGLIWILPYWIGRTFFNSAEGMRDLAVGLVVGGLIYVPFCLLEVRLSPQLNNMVYGFRQNDFIRNIRFEGFRPVVFMQSGLMVGTWMAASTVVAFWLWVTGGKKLFGIPWAAICGVLLVTTVLCKAMYAILLMFAALLLLGLLRTRKTVLPLVLLLLCVPTYMLVRATRSLPIEIPTAAATAVFGPDRAQSLEARLKQEDLIVEHVAERPVFGWGGYRRSWPKDPYTETYNIRGLDGLWAIVLGENGIFGLASLFAMLLVPVGLVLWRIDAATLNKNEYGATAALAVSLLLFACDCLLNGMINPVYVMVAGGLAALPALPNEATDREASPSLARRLELSPAEPVTSAWSGGTHG